MRSERKFNDMKKRLAIYSQAVFVGRCNIGRNL